MNVDMLFMILNTTLVVVKVKDPKLSFHLVPRHRSSQSKDGLRFLQGFLRRALNGVAADVQGTDFSEVAYDAVHEKVSRGTH